MSSNSLNDRPETIVRQNITIKIDPRNETFLNLIAVLDCVIIIMGTLGNLISFYLLTRKRLRSVSSMRYLASLTLVDTVCLYGFYLSSVYRQLNNEPFSIKKLENIGPFMCKLISYMSYTSLQMSSILLCVVTIDRLLIITSANWRSKYANPQFANKIIVIILLVLMAFNVIIPISLGNKELALYSVKNLKDELINVTTLKASNLVSNSDDSYDYSIMSSTSSALGNKGSTTITSTNPFLMLLCYDESIRVFKIWRKIHLCIYSLIPFPILSVLNLIVIRLTRVAALAAVQTNTNMKRFKHGQQFVTRLLLILTVSFLCTTLPSTILYAFWYDYILNQQYGRVFLNILNTFQFSRHAFNWIIYVYSSSFMREEFKKCVSCAESDYEIAEAAVLAAERPSLAIEILRQIEMNNNSSLDPEFYEYYNLKRQQQKLSKNKAINYDDANAENNIKNKLNNKSAIDFDTT